MADRRDLREDKVLNPGHPLSEGLVGCWLFNEGAGGLVQDLSPKWKRLSVCKICDELPWRRNMCRKHYIRFRKYGDPCLTKKRIGSSYVLIRETLGVKKEGQD